ncbi:MAG: RidA family protein [Alphaproteobacteria bacterium]|nr:RidA family protein [Alphaproteobacteria bacterium]
MSINRIDPNPTMSRAVECNGMVFLCGLTADDKSASMKDQTTEVLAKIDGFLAKAGTDKSKLLTATVYISDMSKKEEMNEAWHAWVDAENPPTRATVGTVLGSPETLVEIVVSAAK